MFRSDLFSFMDWNIANSRNNMLIKMNWINDALLKQIWRFE